MIDYYGNQSGEHFCKLFKIKMLDFLYLVLGMSRYDHTFFKRYPDG